MGCSIKFACEIWYFSGLATILVAVLATVLATFYTIVLIYFDNLVTLSEDTEVVGAGNEEH